MPRYEPLNWYEQPLWYDIVFDVETSTEADFIEAVHERFVTSGGRRVLEPACGTGRLVAAMAKRGYRVTGFDNSEPAIRFARQRLASARLQARLMTAAMERFSVARRFDLAYCLVSTFKYLLTEEAARSHLQAMADALKPGGVYLLGFHLTDYTTQARSRERWIGRRDGVEVICNIQSWPPDRRRRLEQVRARLNVRHKGSERRFETHWAFRTYSAAQVQRLVGTVPQFEHVATFTFTYEIDRPIRFDGTWLDNVLILRRRPAS